MSDSLQSGESRLQDVLYDYQALREMAGQEPEAVVIDQELIDNASVFIDGVSGNRIAIGALPDSQADFSGTLLSITGIDKPLEIIGLTGCREAAFAVSSLGRVYARNLTTGETWREFSADELTRVLDVPYAKPQAVSEHDPRNAPPVLQGASPIAGPPEALFEYYRQIIDTDILAIPKVDVYTALSSMFDHAVRDRTDMPLHTTLTRDGVFQSPFKLQLFSLVAREVLPLDTSFADFERVFRVTFQSLNGNTVFPAYKLGAKPDNDNLVLRGDSKFEFKVSREGMLIYDTEEGRQMLRVPHSLSVTMLHQALTVGQDFQA